jgi:hypothetical protein
MGTDGFIELDQDCWLVLAKYNLVLATLFGVLAASSRVLLADNGPLLVETGSSRSCSGPFRRTPGCRPDPWRRVGPASPRPGLVISLRRIRRRPRHVVGAERARSGHCGRSPLRGGHGSVDARSARRRGCEARRGRPAPASLTGAPCRCVRSHDRRRRARASEPVATRSVVELSRTPVGIAPY